MWPNARDMLRPTMLRYVTLSFFRSFGRGFNNQPYLDIRTSANLTKRFLFSCISLFVLSPGQTITTCELNISQHCWVQHVVCVWPPCCDMLGVVGPNLTIFKLEPTTPNIATRWPNAHNMLRPTMLGYVALACCDPLAAALVSEMNFSKLKASKILHKNYSFWMRPYLSKL